MRLDAAGSVVSVARMSVSEMRGSLSVIQHRQIVAGGTARSCAQPQRSARLIPDIASLIRATALRHIEFTIVVSVALAAP